jgi:hypothetical protein
MKPSCKANSHFPQPKIINLTIIISQLEFAQSSCKELTNKTTLKLRNLTRKSSYIAQTCLRNQNSQSDKRENECLLSVST